tara:strand:+ start:121 stop:672 length:552 start_codon:yes stop_codon:yes gene_type:complete
MNYVHNNEAYCTHQKYTSEELDKLGDNAVVLELGVGNGSSPLMYEFCKNNPNCIVQSFETDASWFEQMFDKYGDLPNYVFNLIETWDDLKDHVTEEKYDFTFVDQSPWMARIESIDLLKEKCDLFILHDYDFFNKSDNPWVKSPCDNIYVSDDTSWLGQKYLGDFNLEDNYEILPPTLIMRKK